LKYFQQGLGLTDESIAFLWRSVEPLKPSAEAVNPAIAVPQVSFGNLFTALFPQRSAEDFLSQGARKYNRGNYRGAIGDYDQAIKLKPDYANTYHNRGLARSALDDKQGAITDYDQSIMLNPDYADAYYNRGLAYKALGDKQEAIADYQKAADLYRQQGKDKDLQDALKRIEELQK
jgi:tetratricopeptide (TPR) repeat protein